MLIDEDSLLESQNYRIFQFITYRNNELNSIIVYFAPFCGHINKQGQNNGGIEDEF